MRRGGCGAKVSATLIDEVLGELRGAGPPEVAIGLDAPDDAVVSRPPPGMVCVQSVDQFGSFVDDPFVFGRIGAVHCLSDLHAMGAKAHLAMVMVTLPYARGRRLTGDLRALLSGVPAVLDAEGVARDRVEDCVRALRSAGYAHAALIGRVSEGEAGRLTTCREAGEDRANE